MKQPVYILHPGWITSRHDGGHHYITCGQLAHLYQVPLEKCLAAGTERELGYHGPAIHLRPRRNGNYKLPKPVTR